VSPDWCGPHTSPIRGGQCPHTRPSSPPGFESRSGGTDETPISAGRRFRGDLGKRFGPADRSGRLRRPKTFGGGPRVALEVRKAGRGRKMTEPWLMGRYEKAGVPWVAVFALAGIVGRASAGLRMEGLPSRPETQEHGQIHGQARTVENPTARKAQVRNWSRSVGKGQGVEGENARRRRLHTKNPP